MQQKFPDENAKLSLDEAAFQRLLAAAFVIQEHNDSIQSQVLDPVEFKAADLSHIAETQNHIRNQNLTLLPAANLVIDRALKISQAGAGALALLAGRELSYVAAAGKAPSLPGSHVPLDQSLSAECIRSSIPLCIANLKNDQRMQAKVLVGRGLQGFAAIPIRRDGQVKAVLELYFDHPRTVDQPTLRACELAGGLLSGLIGQPLPQIPDSQTAPLSSLDQLRAEFDQLLERDPDSLPGVHPSPAPREIPPPAATGVSFPSPPASAMARCRNCGCPLEPEESFCGLCGTSRNASTAAGAKSAPAPSAAEKISLPAPSAPAPVSKPVPLSPAPATAAKPDLPSPSEPLPAELQEILARFPEESPAPVPIPKAAVATAVAPIAASAPAAVTTTLPSSPPRGEQAKGEPAKVEPAKIEIEKPEKQTLKTGGAPAPTTPVLPTAGPSAAASPALASPALSPPATEAPVPAGQWKSAAETRAWLESVKVDQPAKHWLAAHRANLYLAIAAILLIMVLFGIGIPASPIGKPHLGWFDSMLVSLGLAEAPTPPVYVGNPNARVWVDLHTALYYCSDAELYGKTNGGRFETQRQAQEEQFEPASRQACP